MPSNVIKLAGLRGRTRSRATAERGQAADESKRLAAILKSQGVLELALDGTIVWANKKFLAALGYRLAELRGRPHSMIVEPALRDSPDYEKFWSELRAGRYQVAEYRRVSKSGRPVWLQASYNPVLDEQGRPLKIIKIATDVTARKRQADEYESQMQAIHKTQAIVEFTLDGTILTANDRFLAATGYTLAEIVGEKHGIFVEPGLRNSSEYRRFWSELRRGRHHTAEYRRMAKDGRPIWFQASYSPVLDHEGRPVKIVKFATDITAWKLKAASAEIDALTGLPNRTLLNDRLTQAITAARRRRTELAVLFLDLDGFKHVNDSLGHLIGDKLLTAVAGRLTNCVRASDTVSRQGGDEFVILLTDLRAAEDAAITAQKILAAIADGFIIDHNQICVTGSIGVSIFPADGAHTATLLKHADTAMYAAKKSGRGTYRFFEQAMNEKASHRQYLSSHLREAATRHELSLLYQPKIDLVSNNVIGAEALLRWRSDIGPVGPAEFIPIAENAGLIRQLGGWVLREACLQLSDWRAAGLTVPRIAINISGLEFRHEDFLDRTLQILAETGTKPSDLELELTESVLMNNANFIAPILAKLRELGMQISLDDFGTGYSSLSYLTKFPIDTLKIDQSFVQDLQPGTHAAIVSAIICMARNLNMRVIAEGVETASHLAALRQLQCDEAQGFYFSRPLAPAEFVSFLTAAPA